MPEPGSPGAARPPGWAYAIEALPPAVRHQVAGALAAIGAVDGAAGGELEDAARRRLERLIADAAPWLGADGALAELGHWMVDARRGVELRRLGCAWLAVFPSADTAQRLGKLALDPATPRPVREQAIAALGARQLQAAHAATRWSAEAVQLADEALVKLAGDATTAGKVTSDQLPHSLRHVASDAVAAVFARAPGLWADALECFASPPLARVLAVSIDDIAPQHRLRVLRLVAATLGEEAIPLMVARVPRAAAGEQLEMLLLAVAFGGEVHLGQLEDVVRGRRLVDGVRARARWHLANRGVVPTVRGLRVARTLATIPVAERAGRCAQAADDLAALTRFERHAEAYVYTLWARMVRVAGDPARARELVAAHPAAQALVRDLHLEDLARRGRVRQLIAAAHALDGVELGALQLAIWGRPLAALELAQAARRPTAELVCARALACYRAGRPDLTDRILAEDLPPPELTDDEALRPFPGPNERWLVERARGERLAPAQLALAALVGGRDAIVALAQPAPLDAEPDATTIEPVAAVARRLDRGLAGSAVYVAGELAPGRRDALAAAALAAGARLVAGPCPGTDYYVVGDRCPVAVIARLERQGARRLPGLEEVGR